MQYPAVHLIDSQAGGKGKSLLTRVMAHFAASHGHLIQLMDADSGKRNIKPFYPETLEISINNEQYWGADSVLAALEQGTSVILNLPAGAHDPVVRWLETDGILDLKLVSSTVANKKFELDAEQGDPITMIKWFLCDATSDSLSDFKRSVRHFTEKHPGRIQHVFVKNFGLSPAYAWDRVDDNELSKLLQQPTIKSMEFPSFPLIERDRIQALQWPFSKGIAKSPEFSAVERQRIVTFVKRTVSAITATKLWNDLPKTSTANDKKDTVAAKGA
jgi:hypothetical protein